MHNHFPSNSMNMCKDFKMSVYGTPCRDSQASSVIHDGVPLRFCQQCGRLHPLHESDGARHSCHVCLHWHNARRQKAGSLVINTTHPPAPIRWYVEHVNSSVYDVWGEEYKATHPQLRKCLLCRVNQIAHHCLAMVGAL